MRLPSCFTELAQEVAAIGLNSKNMSVEVIKGEELKLRGFGGIYAVGKGGTKPGHLVRLTIQGTDPNAEGAR